MKGAWKTLWAFAWVLIALFFLICAPFPMRGELMDGGKTYLLCGGVCFISAVLFYDFARLEKWKGWKRVALAVFVGLAAFAAAGLLSGWDYQGALVLLVFFLGAELHCLFGPEDGE